MKHTSKPFFAAIHTISYIELLSYYRLCSRLSYLRMDPSASTIPSLLFFK